MQLDKKIVRCPKCGIEGESNWDDTELTCPDCGHSWTHLIPRNTNRHDYFLFLDYETTGEPEKKILEVAWMLTDSNLQVIFEPQSLVISFPPYYAKMADNIKEMHTKNGLLDQCALSTLTVTEADELITKDIEKHLTPGEDGDIRVTLAGFTCHYDRELMKLNMPSLDDWLHYRHFDVSVLRSAYHYWVENIPSKKDQHPHRAKNDIIAAWEIAKTFQTLFQIRMPKLNDPEIAGMVI